MFVVDIRYSRYWYVNYKCYLLVVDILIRVVDIRYSRYWYVNYKCYLLVVGILIRVVDIQYSRYWYVNYKCYFFGGRRNCCIVTMWWRRRRGCWRRRMCWISAARFLAVKLRIPPLMNRLSFLRIRRGWFLLSDLSSCMNLALDVELVLITWWFFTNLQ